MWAFLYKVVMPGGTTKNNKKLVTSFIENLYADRVVPILALDVKDDKLVLDRCMEFHNSEVRNKNLKT